MTSFSSIMSAMPGKRITVVGDVMLDQFVTGKVNRISPEAPVPVLTYQSESLMPGGAANVARNLARFGILSTLIGVVGQDDNASKLVTCLAEEPSITLKAIADRQRLTTVKTRFTSSGQQILRLDHEVTAPLSPALTKRLVNTVKSALSKTDVLILSDYNKGLLDQNTVQALIALAKDAGVTVVADPKKNDPSVYKGCDLITPNLQEFRQMTGLDLTSRDAIIDAAKAMVRRQKLGAILITLGADGMVLVTKGQPPLSVQAQAKTVFDVSGAGDTVIAAIAATLATGGTLDDAIRLATVAAGLVVGKSGTATVLAGEILAETSPSYGKSQEDVQAMVKSWRDEGLTIGFTNGCFDLLHPGHLWVLEKAAACCDKLIVGLNSDQSTRRLKGQGRPFQDEGTRAAVLAGLPMVDAVVIFDSPTPAKLIKAIAPDRLIKGGDYNAKDVVGRQTVLARGGKVVIIPTKPGFSTTRLSKA